ncbi:MAG: DUF3078 domain-containing protein [Cytophagaceae bacterium]|nr:DUF3078 domain-containing protein [Cytophagaceae bacterium]MDW8456148.1 DUF3078 domain-containing protein [Cytophagaceae bacterium]
MYRMFLCLVVLLLSITPIWAQSPDSLKSWQLSTKESFNLSQSSFTNWVAGGENTVAWTILSSSFANYEKGKTRWSNALDMAYGMSKIGGKPFRKTDDKLIFVSKLSYGKSDKLKYSALLDFRTQFAPGYKYPDDTTEVLTSKFLSPGYGILGLGLDYTPIKNLYVFYSPLTAKITIVNHQPFADAGEFGVKAAEKDSAGNIITPGKKIRFEPGGYLTAKYSRDLTENLAMQTNLNLFHAYIVQDATTQKHDLTGI